jgi:hypothetical protein
LGDGKHTNDCLGMDEVAPVCMVEVCDTFTRKLQMLLLVMSDRHMSCPWGGGSSATDLVVRVSDLLLRRTTTHCNNKGALPVDEDISSLEHGV